MTEDEFQAREARIMEAQPSDFLMLIALALVFANAIVWAAVLS
jgi:hypothetical protein